MSRDCSNDGATIVVLGATGQQGGAVARSLAQDGQWRLRTVTRNPDSPAAQDLVKRGFDVVAADMDDPHTLRTAFKGAHGVFSVQTSDQRQDLETRRGTNVARAAADAGVAHFVYASVGGAERDSGVPHFESKWRIEQAVQETGLPATIVRPAFFMDNFDKGAMRVVLGALMREYLPKDKPLQMIAVADIGDWVARAFAAPDTFIGQAQEIAGDELTQKQIATTLRAGGLTPGLPFPLPGVLLRRLPADVVKMFEWFGRAGYQADIQGLRSEQPRLRTLGDWVSLHDAPAAVAVK